RLATARHRSEPRGHDRSYADRSFGIEVRISLLLLELATVRLPAQTKVERRAVGGVGPEHRHSLAGPVLFAEVVLVAEEAPRRADQVAKPADRGVEVGWVFGDRIGPGQREGRFARVVEALAIDGSSFDAVEVVHELAVGSLQRAQEMGELGDLGPVAGVDVA